MKMLYINTRKYYLATKKNEILIYDTSYIYDNNAVIIYKYYFT